MSGALGVLEAPDDSGEFGLDEEKRVESIPSIQRLRSRNILGYFVWSCLDHHC